MIFPFICSNIPAAPVYEVYISQLIRYSRPCGSYQDFLDKGLLLTRKLLNQGFLLVKFKSLPRRFYGRHLDLVDRYGISVSQVTTDMFHLSSTFRAFPHLWLVTESVTRFTRRVPLVEKELLILPEHLSSPPVLSGVCVIRSLVLCVCFVDRCLSFCTFQLGHYVVCTSSIYGFWLPPFGIFKIFLYMAVRIGFAYTRSIQGTFVIVGLCWGVRLSVCTMFVDDKCRYIGHYTKTEYNDNQHTCTCITRRASTLLIYLDTKLMKCSLNYFTNHKIRMFVLVINICRNQTTIIIAVLFGYLWFIFRILEYRE